MTSPYQIHADILKTGVKVKSLEKSIEKMEERIVNKLLSGIESRLMTIQNAVITKSPTDCVCPRCGMIT